MKVRNPRCRSSMKTAATIAAWVVPMLRAPTAYLPVRNGAQYCERRDKMKLLLIYLSG
jgi:hypothetical protein